MGALRRVIVVALAGAALTASLTLALGSARPASAGGLTPEQLFERLCPTSVTGGATIPLLPLGFGGSAASSNQVDCAYGNSLGSPLRHITFTATLVGTCKEDAPPFYYSDRFAFSVFVPSDLVRAEGISGEGAATLGAAFVALAEEAGFGSRFPCPGQPPPEPEPVVKEAQLLTPGATKKVVGPPLGKSQRRAEVEIEADAQDLANVGLALLEKARRITTLKRAQVKLEANCDLAFFGALLHDAITEEVVQGLTVGPRSLKIDKVCGLLLKEVQERLAALESERPAHGARGFAGEGTSCAVASIPLRSERVKGKWRTTVLKRGSAPRLEVTCAAVEEDDLFNDTVRLTIQRRGKGTLRQAVGNRLTLLVARSPAAPELVHGPPVTLTFDR